MQINMKDYNLDSFKKKDLYEWDEIIDIIDTLEYENQKLKDELNQLKADIQDNYRPIPVNEQYDVYDNMFI